MPPSCLKREDAAEALALERLVADGEDLVEQQDVRVEEGGDREAEPHRHPRRVRPHGPVDRVLELRERDDLVEPLPDVGAAEALDRAVQEDVLAPGEVEVEPGAELEQRADPPLRAHASGRRLDDPGDEPQQRRLARAVAPDEPDGLAARDARARRRGAPRRRSPAVRPRWTKRSFSVRASRAWMRNRRETPSTLISPGSIADLD